MESHVETEVMASNAATQESDARFDENGPVICERLFQKFMNQKMYRAVSNGV